MNITDKIPAGELPRGREGSKLRQSRLKLCYEASDLSLIEAFSAPLCELISRISLVVFNPIVQKLPEILAAVIEEGRNLPLDVLLVFPDPAPPSDGTRQEIGKLLKKYRDRSFVDFRWASGWMSTLPEADTPLFALILREVRIGGQTVVLAASSQDPEHIRVFWSWGDPLKRAQDFTNKFDAIWTNGRTQQLKPLWDDLGFETSEHALPSLYKHQIAALRAWEQNGFQGIFEMCTGAGKTVAALAGSLLLHQRLKDKGQVLSGIVILCPKRVLVEQWERELLAKGFTVSALVYDSPQYYLDQLDTALRGNKPRYIISTYDSFVLPRFQSLLKGAADSGRRGLLIADEMHWCASSDRRDSLRASGKYFSWRLGLSATPEIEGNEAATKQLQEYFGGILKEARYGLEEALRDKVLCPYVYHPVPAFLDAKTSAKYFDILRRTTDRTGKIDLAAYSERRKILRKGEMQIHALEAICDEINARKGSFDHTLVFCPPGDDYDDHEESDDETTPLINRIKRVFQEREILCTSILAETSHREQALKDFEDVTVSILLAIGCLDEGMDVPSTQRAIMLYSVDRLRQFVQRRGRVLRKHPKKEVSEIIDLIVLPHNADLPESVADDLLRRELRRYTEFARLANNAKEAQIILEKAIRTATGKRIKQAYA